MFFLITFRFFDFFYEHFPLYVFAIYNINNSLHLARYSLLSADINLSAGNYKCGEANSFRKQSSRKIVSSEL